jgi:hypothetical protein
MIDFLAFLKHPMMHMLTCFSTNTSFAKLMKRFLFFSFFLPLHYLLLSSLVSLAPSLHVLTTCDHLSFVFSFLEFPIPNSIAFIGEVGLGGELRTVRTCFHVIGINIHVTSCKIQVSFCTNIIDVRCLSEARLMAFLLLSFFLVMEAVF